MRHALLFVEHLWSTPSPIDLFCRLGHVGPDWPALKPAAAAGLDLAGAWLAACMACDKAQSKSASSSSSRCNYQSILQQKKISVALEHNFRFHPRDLVAINLALATISKYIATAKKGCN
jgi:hypothetical protein